MYPDKFNLNVTHPDGKCSKNVVSSPGCYSVLFTMTVNTRADQTSLRNCPGTPVSFYHLPQRRMFKA